MRISPRFGMVVLGLLLVAGVGWLLAVSGNGSARVVYEADVPDWHWTAGPFRDQYLALLQDETDLVRARSALPDHVWRQVGERIEAWLAEGDTAVVVAFLGQAATGGYAIRVVRVEVQEARQAKSSRPIVSVVVARRRPAPGEFVTQAFTYPYDVVPVAKNLLPDEPYDVRFVDPEGLPLEDGRQAFSGRVSPRPPEVVHLAPAPPPAPLPASDGEPEDKAKSEDEAATADDEGTEDEATPAAESRQEDAPEHGDTSGAEGETSAGNT